MSPINANASAAHEKLLHAVIIANTSHTTTSPSRIPNTSPTALFAYLMIGRDAIILVARSTIFNITNTTTNTVIYTIA